MQEANLSTIEKSMQQGDSHIESGYRIGQSLLQSPAPPTAIFTMNNRMALGVLRAIREAGTSCPGQVSVMSFDDSDWASVLTPSLTTIAQPSYEIGKASVKLLLQAVDLARNDVEVEAKEIMLKSTLCVRESTARAARRVK